LYVTNLALWLQDFNKLTYLQGENAAYTGFISTNSLTCE